MGYSFITEKLNRNFIRAAFIMENGQLRHESCVYKVNNTFKLEGKCAYIVDHKLIKYDKSKPYLFYFHDNPNPITFVHSKLEISGKVISSESFFDILNSKVIKEMVSSGQAADLLLILVAVTLFIGILNFAASAGIISFAHNAASNMTANMTAAVVH